jgi:hypothetical protein
VGEIMSVIEGIWTLWSSNYETYPDVIPMECHKNTLLNDSDLVRAGTLSDIKARYVFNGFTDLVFEMTPCPFYKCYSYNNQELDLWPVGLIKDLWKLTRKLVSNEGMAYILTKYFEFSLNDNGHIIKRVRDLQYDKILVSDKEFQKYRSSIVLDIRELLEQYHVGNKSLRDIKITTLDENNISRYRNLI